MPGLNGHQPLPIETARLMLRRNMLTIPVPYKTKTPNDRANWIGERWGEADFERLYTGVHTNIGVLLGGKSGYVDADLDTKEAVAAAPYYLPATTMKWGRPGKPDSHWGYVLETMTANKNIPFKDPLIRKTDANAENRAMLCEMRVHGQTIAPGSIHPSGELIDWSPDARASGDPIPTLVSYETLKTALGAVAAVAELARYWAEGVRHDAALPLAGMLCRGGLDENQTNHFVKVLCAISGDDGVANRLEAVSDTYRRAERGEPFTGGSALEEYFDPRIIARIRAWLNLSSSAYGGYTGPDGFPLSDIGNAERFAKKWTGRVLFCDDENCWYLFDERRWIRDRANQMYRKAMEVVTEFRVLANDPKTVAPNSSTLAQPVDWRKHAERSESQKAIRAMLELVKSFVPVLPEEFDADPLLGNATNGTMEFDIRSGEVYLREFRADDRLTKLYAAPYLGSDATHPLLEQARLRFFPEPERWEFMEEVAGYALHGLPKRHALELWGKHDSGKSTILKMFVNTWGDYGASLAAEQLSVGKNHGGDIGRPMLWKRRAARLWVVTEVGPEDRLDIDLFKALTSGGDAYAMRTFRDATGGADIVFGVSLWMSGNDPYGPPPGEEAAFARLDVLECLHVVPESERVSSEEHDTTDASIVGSAVLAAAARGFKRLYGEKKGVLVPPESAIRAKEKLRNELDDWSGAIDSLFLFTGDPTDGVLRDQAWKAARELYEIENEHSIKRPASAKEKFEDSMTRRGAAPLKTQQWADNRMLWTGVRWDETNVELGESYVQFKRAAKN